MSTDEPAPGFGADETLYEALNLIKLSSLPTTPPVPLKIGDTLTIKSQDRTVQLQAVRYNAGELMLYFKSGSLADLEWIAMTSKSALAPADR